MAQALLGPHNTLPAHPQKSRKNPKKARPMPVPSDRPDGITPSPQPVGSGVTPKLPPQASAPEPDEDAPSPGRPLWVWLVTVGYCSLLASLLVLIAWAGLASIDEGNPVAFLMVTIPV